MNLIHLGRAAKHFHPGAYDQYDDARLGAAMAKKHPGLYGDSSTPPAGSPFDAKTRPETPKTLQIQLGQLHDGKRRAVFVARGSKLDIIAADYGARKLPTPAGEFYYNPERITPRDIFAALKHHTLSDILGDADKGYGTPDKTELQRPLRAVVARDAAGETANSALTDPEHEPSAIDAARGLTPQGGSVSVESPAKELANRKPPKTSPNAPQSPDEVDMPDSSVMAKPLKVKRPGGRGARWPKP